MKWLLRLLLFVGVFVALVIWSGGLLQWGDENMPDEYS